MKALISFHTPVNAGYAMSKLERTFFDVMLAITGNEKNITFSFTQYQGEQSKSLPSTFSNVFELDHKKLNNKEYYKEKLETIRQGKFDLALSFDLQVSGSAVNVLREARIKTVISYWGSTISGMNSGPKLWAKKLQVALNRKKPDLFIFESESMRKYATHGRGISTRTTEVIQTGVNTSELQPASSSKHYVREMFSIPEASNVAIYSGHMEKRKGVHVIIEAFIHLVKELKDKNWHMLICGNRPGEEINFINTLANCEARNHVTFCGYRDDLPQILPGCDVGIIASTGWDSFPMSALEMAACGLPLLASELQGLTETIENGKTGILFPPGDHVELARLLHELGNDGARRSNMSLAARKRIVDTLSLGIQKKRLISAISKLVKKAEIV